MTTRIDPVTAWDDSPANDDDRYEYEERLPCPECTPKEECVCPLCEGAGTVTHAELDEWVEGVLR